MSQIRLLYWFSIAWIIVAFSGLLASGPIAYKILITGSQPTGRETEILAWVALLVILAIPAGVSMFYCRNHIRDEEEFWKWIPEDTAPNQSRASNRR